MKRIILVVYLSLVSFVVFAKDINVVEIMKMRTHDIRSQSVQSWLRTIGRFPIVSNYDGGSQYYTYYNEGVSILFKNGILKSSFAYAEGVADHRQYNGPLPYGLKMTMRKNEIEKILGKSEAELVDGKTNYPKKYIAIEYDDIGLDARPNVITLY
jgi:hypothetical protein